MSNKIQVKRSSVAGKVPVAADLEVGELAVNLVDRRLFSKDGNGIVFEIANLDGLMQYGQFQDVTANIPSALVGAPEGTVIINSAATAAQPHVSWQMPTGPNILSGALVIAVGGGVWLPIATGGSGGAALPADAAGFLQNDGAGALSWGTPAGGGGTALPANAAGSLVNDGAGTLSWVDHLTQAEADARYPRSPANAAGALVNDGSGGLSWSPQLALGTTATTAAAGNHDHASSDLTDWPAAKAGYLEMSAAGALSVNAPVTTSPGAAVSGKLIAANAQGKLDPSFYVASVMQFKGSVAPTALPANPDTGDMVILNAAGTVNGVTVAAGDFAVYDGTNWEAIAMSTGVAFPTNRAGALMNDGTGTLVWDDVIIPDPAAGVSQTITAADPADTPLTLTGATGQTASLLKAGPLNTLSDRVVIDGANAAYGLQVSQTLGTSTTAMLVRAPNSASANIAFVDQVTSSTNRVKIGSTGDALVFHSGTGGAERGRFADTGNLLINTAAPLGTPASTAKLQINTPDQGIRIDTASTVNKDRLLDFYQGTTNLAFITATGNAKFGSGQPFAAATPGWTASLSNTAFIFRDNTATNISATGKFRLSHTNAGMEIYTDKSTDTDPEYPSFSITNDPAAFGTVFNVRHDGKVIVGAGTNTTLVGAGTAKLQVNGAIFSQNSNASDTNWLTVSNPASAGAYGAGLSLKTSAAGSTVISKNSAGATELANSTPSQPIQISGTDPGGTPRAVLTLSPAGVAAKIIADVGEYLWVTAGSVTYKQGIYGSGNAYLQNALTTGSELPLCIQPTGSVAVVGSNAPIAAAGAAKLQVNGEAYISSKTGIGTTAPPTIKLEVNGALGSITPAGGGAASIRLNDRGEEKLRIASGGTAGDPAYFFGANGFQFATVGTSGGEPQLVVNPRSAGGVDDGNVLVNATAPIAAAGTAKLQVNGDAFASGGVLTTSDAQVKSDIREEDIDLEALAAVKPKRYTKDGREEVGIVAQDLEAVFPAAVQVTSLVPDDWDAGKDYRQGDKVLHGGTVYTALADVATGIQPDDVWTDEIIETVQVPNPEYDAEQAAQNEEYFVDEYLNEEKYTPASGGWKPEGDLDSYLPQSANGKPMRETRAIYLDRVNAMLMGAVSKLVESNKQLESRIAALEA